jgi:hypothetical protein
MNLRILITNNALADRAGTELYVRDLSLSLQERGHTPLVYSTRLGGVAAELHKATIPVLDDLSHLPFKPDIIHGQHHLDTMTALLSLPGVPAIYFCHGWLPWEEMPPVFPRILRYVAVDRACLDRVLYEARIPEDKTLLLLNFVDLKRFQPRGPLPPKARRALIFSNRARQNNFAKSIRQACARFQIEVDVIGHSAGNPTGEPEKLLPQYDLVFAKGRAAMEALAVGNAVVVCDSAGCGPLVGTQNFDRLRSLNFGIRTMRPPVTVENVVEQIGHYDAKEAAKVSQLIRAQADLERTTDQLLDLYEEVIGEFKEAPQPDPTAELQAAGAYLQSFSALAKRVLNGRRAPAGVKPGLKRGVSRLAEKMMRWSGSHRNL